MNPTQYDREQIKRLRSMKEGGNAIFNTNALDFAFYGNEARKNLMLQSIADQNEVRDARFNEGVKQFNTGEAMAREKRKDASKADNTAEMFGWGDIALGGFQGVNAYNKEKKQADQMDEMTETIKALIRR
jgi:hypothetical protein